MSFSDTVVATAVVVSAVALSVAIACASDGDGNRSNGPSYTTYTTSYTTDFRDTDRKHVIEIHNIERRPTRVVNFTTNYTAQPKPFVQQPMNNVRQFDGGNNFGPMSAPPRSHR